MKRTLAMLLALIMILSCLATATAEGGQMGGARPEDGLETLVEQGVISEETLEAILEYMDEHRPEQAEGPQGGGQNGSAPQPRLSFINSVLSAAFSGITKLRPLSVL